MARRMLNVLLLGWAAALFVVLGSHQVALADPIDCDNDCRQVYVVASVNGKDDSGKLIIRCTKFKYTDCNICVFSGGCVNSLPALGGTCVQDKTVTQEEGQPSCVILCPNPAVGKTYEAHTNDDPTYKPSPLRMWCGS